MIRLIQGLLVATIAVLLTGCVGQPPTTMRSVDIVYLGNLDGELEPCGCTEEGDLGGILRQTTHIDELRNAHPDLFLLHTGGLFNIATGTDRITSEFILSGMRAQAYDVVGVQWKDLAYGREFLQESSLPFVASNWSDAAFPKIREIQHGQQRLAFFQWLDPEQSPYRKMKGDHFRVEEGTDELGDALAAARKRGALTVLASGMSKEETLARLPLENVDIVILTAAYEHYAEPQRIDGVLFLQPGSRGQRIGHLQVQLNAAGRLEKFSHEVTALPAKVPDTPRLAGWYAGFTEALRADYRQRVAHRKAQAQQPSLYVGETACTECHQQAFNSWRQSRHARAFATLERENKAFDANCLACHTVAFNQPGGFVDPDITPDRLNVQCENCHGPGRSHVESGGKQPLPQRPTGGNGPVCLQCHNRSHSPSFDFGVYWPKISHGLDPKQTAQTPGQ